MVPAIQNTGTKYRRISKGARKSRVPALSQKRLDSRIASGILPISVSSTLFNGVIFISNLPQVFIIDLPYAHQQFVYFYRHSSSVAN
ncbi:hypothetical protein [Methylomonas koyamae]|uniref:hypothetical protein n=1 Tax=Methylomonas koyamae TaxID=702114 RepID=UPI0021106DDB|nr:hypothetical protein [Methylomonas koyamae]